MSNEKNRIVVVGSVSTEDKELMDNFAEKISDPDGQRQCGEDAGVIGDIPAPVEHEPGTILGSDGKKAGEGGSAIITDLTAGKRVGGAFAGTEEEQNGDGDEVSPDFGNFTRGKNDRIYSPGSPIIANPQGVGFVEPS